MQTSSFPCDITKSPAVVYDATHLQGRCTGLPYGMYPDLNKVGIGGNTISSYQVAPFTRVTFYDGPNFEIQRTPPLVVLGPAAEIDMVQHGWNDAIESIKVERVQNLELAASCCLGDRTAAECGDYVRGSPKCLDVMAQYCSADNLQKNPRCRDWCKRHPGRCDEAAKQYCKGNNSDFCSCINSPVLLNGGAFVNPACVDGTCIGSGGYRTALMDPTINKCPDIIDCRIQNTLTAGGRILGVGLKIDQSCGNKPASQPDQPSARPDIPVTRPDIPVTRPDIPAVPPETPASQSEAPAATKTIMWIFLALFMIVLGYLIAVNMTAEPDVR